MARSTKFEIKQSTAGSSLTVSVAGELDMDTAETLWKHLEESLDSAVGELTLDLRDLEFMDSTGLRLLIKLNHRSQKEAWGLRLLAPRNEMAALVLRVTGTDTALPFEDGSQG